MQKILVIEDEAEVRDNIQQILELENFIVIPAENGHMGIQLTKVHAPDLIICDIMMPDIDGYGVLEVLQQDANTRTIPLIFLTAKADRSAMRHGIELGADDYLTKPFTPSELVKAIAIRLQKRSTITQHYIQQIQQAEAGLDYLIHYDHLTQLANKKLLEERFEQMRAQAKQVQIISLIAICLDQFNRLSDTFGHTFGDSLIKAIAERLQANFTNLESVNTLAHLRTDQFVLLLQPISQEQKAREIAEVILHILSEPLSLNGHSIFITGSIGITFAYNSHIHIDSLITQAEMAMGQAKREGGNRSHSYTPKLQVVPSELLSLESSLRQALAQNEFQVYYQPQVDLQTRQIVGAEALVRWQHPELGFIHPSRFIPLAEETGLIIPLGEWVLRMACKQAQAWQQVKLGLQVAVNLSARQFSQSDLSQKIVRILGETGLDPILLDLELTESALMQDVKTAGDTLKTLRALGIQLSIDDFGTGYSSLSYLQQFPFNVIKIDQCFVHNIDSNLGNAAITKAIIEMAHSLNFRVIAEGVETEAELAFLQQSDCDAFQGYLFSRPLHAQSFTKLLQEGKGK